MRRLFLSVLMAVFFIFGLVKEASAVTPAVWESSFGSDLGLGDDTTTAVVFGFSFPFLGGSYSGATVSSNGFLWLATNSDAGCCDASLSEFLNEDPRISPAWYDQNPGSTGDVRFNTFTDRAVVTWDGVAEFSNQTPNTYQVQLLSDGRIIFGYDVLTPNADLDGHRHHALIGVTIGGGTSDPGEIDYSAALPLSTGSEGTVYEFFARGPNGSTEVGGDTFDLDGTNICFSPNASGGWDVSASCGDGQPPPLEPVIPEPASLMLFQLGIVAVGFLRSRPRV